VFRVVKFSNQMKIMTASFSFRVIATITRPLQICRTVPFIALIVSLTAHSVHSADVGTSRKSLAAARVFSEPLVPTGEPTDAENMALAAALERFRARNAQDDFSALTGFLTQFSDSKWGASLWYHLGNEYYNGAYYSKALDAWNRSWELAKNASDDDCKRLADRAGGEYALMLARVGRMGDLARIVSELDKRSVIGSASERVAGARQGLWSMQSQPQTSFRCGPLALDRINAAMNPTNVGHQLIRGAESTTNGFSLAQVAELSRKLGMNYQMAFRSAGAEFISPAVVHWKVGHYAALIKKTEDGHYHLQDPTFSNDAWATERAMEEETSGYYLIPSGPLPKGWRSVPESEGEAVFGKGQTNNSDPDSNSDDDKKNDDCGGGKGMAVANVHLMVVSLSIEDRPVGYSPPVGPSVSFRAVYSQREPRQPAAFSYSNLGPKWTFNWLSYITDNPFSPSANVSLYVDGGGTQPFAGYNSSTRTYQVQLKSQTLLTRVSTNRYELLFPDGSKHVFAQPDGSASSTRRVFMTQMIDPAGNTADINYDASLRITSIRDAIGQITTLAYEHPTEPLKITRVTDPFGRFGTFAYDTSGRLTNITDSINLSSGFAYSGSTDFINAMTTPYGTSRFAWGQAGRTRWVELTDPQGDTERIEFNEQINIGIPNAELYTEVPKGLATRNWVNYARNTFVWSKKAFHEARNDYTKALIYHWQHTANYSDSFGVLENMKPPLESRIWYNYPGQGIDNDSGTIPGTSDKPSVVARVLDDGSTQLARYGYNILGNLTNSVDPIGRRMAYVYSTNNVDLLEIRQTSGTNNDLIGRFAYDAQHRPLLVTDAAGQTTTNTYNARGQLLTTSNPLGQTRTFEYDANGYLLAIDGPLPSTNDTTRFTYDAVGRIRTLIDMDGYTLIYDYDNLDRLTRITYPDGTYEGYTYDRLDRAVMRDRMGRETRHAYNPIRQVVQTVDPLNRTNRFDYCDCGALSALTDAMGRTTRWHYDVQGRLTAKEYVDGSRISYAYESTTGRPNSVTDEKGQVKLYDYYADNNRRQVRYPNALVPTPAVTFTYETNYNRVKTMQDGIGLTTYAYHPAGTLGALQVSSLDGPWTNDTITYAHDTLGRVINRAINGVPQTMAYDEAGRTTNIVNVLGSFRYAYDGPTRRLLDTFYPNGQTTHYDYFDNAQDHRLQRLTHRKPDTSLLSRLTYGYTPHGTITNWLQELGTYTEAWAAGYDDADQLTSVAATTSAGTTNTAYAYDKAGNRLVEQVASSRREFIYNALNELTASSDATTNGVTYEWDAEQRLTAINAGSARTEFSYDGQGRRYRTVEKENGIVQAEWRFVWCGFSICEQRDAANTVTHRFFGQGEQQGTTPLFYARDLLGSVLELNDSAATSRARYTYESFGASRKYSGDLDASFGFTGHFSHVRSGLVMAPYRTYSPVQGRWISRDPLHEIGGLNLYAYVNNDPLTFVDLSGRNPIAGAIGGAELGGAAGTFVCPGPGTAAGAVAGAVVGVIAGIIVGEAIVDAVQSSRYGNCTPQQHAALQAAVNAACKGEGGPRRCEPNQSREQLQENLRKFLACKAARDTINTICYGGGNSGHREAADNAGRGAQRCEGFLNP
jgi:RHS repeat-associated protein